ncbi:multi-sensor signal transduction histidine kinase [Leptolyngbya sp. NIES-3755]|nr:multi-sensor signal transduction histidine kinase [Leptolyngbya sp. NIES-3755]
MPFVSPFSRPSLASSDRSSQPLNRDAIGSRIARQLIPVAIALPLVLGWLIFQGQQFGWYNSGFGLVLFAGLMGVIALGLIRRGAGMLNQVDRDRKRSLDRLRSSEERLELAQVAADFATWEWDSLTGKLVWSEQGYSLFGVSPDDPTPFNTWQSRIYADDAAATQTAIEQCLTTGIADVEYRINHPEQGLRWVFSRAGLASDNPKLMRGISFDITDRKQAETEIQRLNRELARRVNELQTILDAVPVGITIADDSACQTIRANGFAQSMLAVLSDTNVSATGAEADRLPFRQLRDGQEIPGEELPMQQAARQGVEVRDVEIQLVRCDGVSYDWLVNAVPLFDEQGVVQGCVAAFADVTVLKQAQRHEQFLSDLDLRLRQLSDADAMAEEAVRQIGHYFQVDRAMWDRVDPDAEFCTVEQDWRRQEEIPSNVGTYRISEYVLPAMVEALHKGQPVVILDVITHPFTAPFAENLLRLNLRSYIGVPCIYEGRWVATLNVTSQTVRHWRSGEVALLQEIVARLWSIIEQTRANQALRDKEQQLQQLSDSMPQFVWMCDAEGKLNYVNQQWIAYAGITLEQSHDPEQIAAIYHPDDVQAGFDQWAIAVETNQIYEHETRLRRASDGTYRWFLVRAVPVLDEQGQAKRWYGTSTDIHDRKLAELNEQFLKDLDLRLRQLSDADAMALEVVRSVGEYLNVDRAVWNEINAAAEFAIAKQDWYQRSDMPSVIGTYPLSNFAPPELLKLYHAGQPVIVADVRTNPHTAALIDNYIPYGVSAYIAVPCVIEGAWVALLAVNSKTARNWRSDEVALLQEIVARLWSIVEQTRINQALREQEERTRLATEAADLGMWFWDIPQDELVWTDRCKALFGFAPTDEITYEVFLNALHPDDRDRTHAAVTRALEEKVEYNIEYRSHWSDGSLHWIAAKGRAFYDAAGQPIRMMGTAQDISDRKQAEQTLRENEQRFVTLSQASPITIFQFDANSACIYINPRWTEMTGHSAEVALGMGWVETLHPNDRDRLTQEWLQWSETADSQHLYQNEGRMVRSDGSTMWYYIEALPVVDPNGAVTGYIGTLSDITQRKQAEFALAARTEELIQTNRLKDEFLAALSHELRTPLNPILGWTTMMQAQRLTPAKTAEVLGTIERNVRQQLRLVDDLLEVSQVIQGKLKLELRPIDLALTLQSAIDTVQFAAEAKSITLKLQGLPALNLIADRDRLQQVFWNLLSNAIKFTPGGGQVSVELSAANHYTQVQISDTGIGIAPEFLPYVFDRFRQADGSSTRKYGGLGLGLSIVQQLVELHGGKVTVESPGLKQGTTFTVTLPIREAWINQAPTVDLNRSETGSFTAFPEASTALTGVRILAVDDDPDNLDLLSFLLQQDGATVTAISSPRSAIGLIANQPFDLIISDIGMPELDGYELMQQIRALPQAQQIPALALTAFVYPEDQEKAIKAGFQAYITKPVNPIELLETVTQLVNR